MSITIVLPLHVQPFVVVPAVFRRDHAVADKDHVGVFNLRFRNEPARDRDVVFGKLRLMFLLAGSE